MMKFLVDECVGLAVARWLRAQNFDAISIIELCAGISDHDVLKRAFDDGRILITSDKDFGEMIFRKKECHYGVILLRMVHDCTENKIKTLSQIIANYAHKLEGNFVVATESTIKIVELKMLIN